MQKQQSIRELRKGFQGACTSEAPFTPRASEFPFGALGFIGFRF